ncbi:MAG: hypothetical protein PHH77_10215 [Victivallaceae bacterium]|nr:hypothetical protein [Victivallaceae bacterium]
MLKSVTVFLAISGLTVTAQTTAISPPPEKPPLPRHSMTREVLLEKIRKAADPNQLAQTWKTAIIKAQLTVPMQQVQLAVTIRYKYPDKCKTTLSMPGIPTITKVFNGKQAWQETAGLGIQMQTGLQFDFAEFECRKSNPALQLAEIYAKITLDPYLYQINGCSCYKLICTLPAKLNVPPTQLFVDTKEFLIRRCIETQLTDMGLIPTTVDASDYRTIKGLKTPMLLTADLMGIRMVTKILSIKVNEKIAASQFKFPESK